MHRKALIQWAAKQVAAYHNGNLNSFQVRELEKLPGWNWKRNYKPRRPPQEWVPIAEQIAAKEKDGRLPTYTQLREHLDLRGLCTVMERHPRLFAHINQRSAYAEIMQRTREKWIVEAEKLAARQPDGKLPYSSHISRMGKVTLRDKLFSHPEWFAHIQRRNGHEERAKQRVARDLAIYRNLIKRFGGKRPSAYQLIGLGYEVIYQRRRKNPAPFIALEKQHCKPQKGGKK